MKKITSEKVIFIFLIFNIILHITYQLVIRTKVPYDWWQENVYVYYPRKIADHFAASFFLLNYFLFGYLVLIRKYCDERLFEGDFADKWRKKAQMCQVGGLVTYAVLWLGFSNSPLLLPVDTPSDFVFNFLYETLSEEQWDSLVNMGYKNYVDMAIMLAPVFLYFIVYIINYWKISIRLKKAECFEKEWNRWNLVYIAIFLSMFCWTFESLRGFDLMKNIPEFSSLLLEYYSEKH